MFANPLCERFAINYHFVFVSTFDISLHRNHDNDDGAVPVDHRSLFFHAFFLPGSAMLTVAARADTRIPTNELPFLPLYLPPSGRLVL
jgi:hypothetical protein